jgi:tetratricopeptide (TPR) repeat protein
VRRLRILSSITLLVTCQFLAAQTGLNAASWARLLGKRNDPQNKSFFQLDSILDRTDSVRTFQFLEDVNSEGPANEYFIARVNCLKAQQLYQKNVQTGVAKVKDEAKKLFTEALHKAYESGDDRLIAFVSIRYGGLIYHFGETDLAVMYLMNGVDLNEQLFGTDVAWNYEALGELLFRIKEYKQSVEYTRKAVESWKLYPSPTVGSSIMNGLNTLALGYHRQGIFDSAFLYYGQALQQANKLNNEVWKGIISGNMGQIYFLQNKYDTALSLLMMDYRISKATGYYDNAGNSLQWAARTQLAKGNKKEALSAIRESLELLKKWPTPNYYRNVYKTAAEIFKATGANDSALFYQQLYSTLNDSLEKVVTLSSIAISKARLNDERSKYSIQNLQRQKKSQLLQRNILIGVIIALALFAYLIVNRQRLKSRLKMEIMQKEIASAKEQMKMFTENIIEKTSLIEKLERQVKSRNASAEQEAIITELSNQTILTEEDWMRFRALFEKIYPGFFTRLKERANDISIAEQRMAALIHLQLTTRQAASMLGISLESVHKTRQRLRQRLHVDHDTTLEVLVSVI